MSRAMTVGAELPGTPLPGARAGIAQPQASMRAPSAATARATPNRPRRMRSLAPLRLKACHPGAICPRRAADATAGCAGPASTLASNGGPGKGVVRSSRMTTPPLSHACANDRLHRRDGHGTS